MICVLKGGPVIDDLCIERWPSERCVERWPSDKR